MVVKYALADIVTRSDMEGKRMRTFRPINGCCPACGEEIQEVDLGVGLKEPSQCLCGWEIGEEVCVCDGCGEVTDYLLDIADGSEFCSDCAVGEELSDAPDPELREVEVA